MTKEEIIDQKLMPYINDPSLRATLSEHGGCAYQTSDGRKCIVGSCLSEEGLKEVLASSKAGVGVIDWSNGARRALDEVNDELDSLLSPEYRGHELRFWAKMQTIHDYDCSMGAVEDLKRKWCE